MRKCSWPSSSRIALASATSRPPRQSRRSWRAAAPAAAASWLLRRGLWPTSTAIRSQAAIASATGVGPNAAAEADQQRISSSSRSSPARRACSAASRHAASAAADWLSVHAIQARRRHARHRPRSSLSVSQRRVGGAARRLGARAGAAVEADELALDVGARLRLRVGGRAGALDRLGQLALGVARAARRRAARRRAPAAARRRRAAVPPRARTGRRPRRRRPAAAHHGPRSRAAAAASAATAPSMPSPSSPR